MYSRGISKATITGAAGRVTFYFQYGRAVWQPVFHVLPCDGPSAAASEFSSMLPSNSSVASDSLPSA